MLRENLFMAWSLPSSHGQKGMEGLPLEQGFTILIADRNPRVRQFLRREMESEGYHVQLAGNGREVLQSVHQEHPDLIILDLDLPDVRETAILNAIREKAPTVPVVVHTFLSEYINHPAILSSVALVEKKGSNIEGLKAVVSDLLRKFYPQRRMPSARTASHASEP